MPWHREHDTVLPGGDPRPTSPAFPHAKALAEAKGGIPPDFGLRERGQRRDGEYAASKSRTFNVPVTTLFEAFTNPRRRKRWLPVAVTVRSVTPHKRMRIIWDDQTVVELGFTAKGAAKSAVAVQHEKLPTRSAADAAKKAWSEHFDRLAQMQAT